MIRPVALFDFDNTVASGDSIARLLSYDLKKHPWHIFYFIMVAIYYLGYLLHLESFEKAKSMLLFPLDYMSDQELENFYHQCVEVHYYPHIVEEMQRKKDEGYVVILCTASCEVYMQYNQLPIDQLLGTMTEYHGHPSRHIVGKNCKNEEKISRILTYLKGQNIEIDYENSYGYSDSDSDLPMLSLVKHKKRILLKSGQITNFDE